MATKYYKSTSYILASIAVMGFAFEISIQNLVQDLKVAFISSLLSGRIYFPSQCLGVCINTGREGERESHLEISFTFYGFLVAITCESE